MMGLLCGVTMLSAQNFIDFEELTLEPETHWNGSNLSGSFTSKSMTFYNQYEEAWGSWLGFAYTNETDNLTNSWDNMYTSASGSGNFGSDNYAVGYVQGDWMNNYVPIPIGIKINTAELTDPFNGMYVSLSAWTSLYIDDAEYYENGNHWLKLVITGINSELDFEISKEIILADYRFSEISNYKMDSWNYINMQWAEGCDSLSFVMFTSDSGDFGPNTPTYFCLDNLIGPEPDEFPTFEAEIKNDFTISLGETVQLSALAKGGVQPYSYAWSETTGLDNYSTQTPIANPTETTTWAVTITDYSGAEITENVTVVVGTSSITNSILHNAETYFNNSGNLVVAANTSIEDLTIFDISGKQILKKQIDSNFAEFSFSEFANGIYIVNISGTNQSIKIVK